MLVDRKQVTLEKNDAATPQKGWSSYFVNVARTQRSEKPFFLTIQFLWPVESRPFDSLSGILTMRLPKIGGAGQANVAVQQLRTGIWVPKHFAMVGTPEGFVSETRSRLSGLLFGKLSADRNTNQLDQWIGGEAGGMFDFPTEGHAYRFSSLAASDTLQVSWWQMPYFAWVLSGSVILIALVLRKTSWENKLGVLLFTGVVIALYALNNPDGVYHGLVAARFGIVAMLAYWMIHALFAT